VPHLNLALWVQNKQIKSNSFSIFWIDVLKPLKLYITLIFKLLRFLPVVGFFCQILMSACLDAYVMFCFWLLQLRGWSLQCLKSTSLTIWSKWVWHWMCLFCHWFKRYSNNYARFLELNSLRTEHCCLRRVNCLQFSPGCSHQITISQDNIKIMSSKIN